MISLDKPSCSSNIAKGIPRVIVDLRVIVVVRKCLAWLLSCSVFMWRGNAPLEKVIITSGRASSQGLFRSSSQTKKIGLGHPNPRRFLKQVYSKSNHFFCLGSSKNRRFCKSGTWHEQTFSFPAAGAASPRGVLLVRPSAHPGVHRTPRNKERLPKWIFNYVLRGSFTR